MPRFPFSQVNVFSSDPLSGNPVAVVHEADAISDEQMLSLARWTNLSETTFLLTPEDPGADYRLRIFTPQGELPFAGHPTLGSCHAWLLSGGEPANAAVVVQQCAAGLIRVRRDGTLLEFSAPPLIRSGPLEDDVLDRIIKALGLEPADIVAHQWVDNGPGWCGVLLRSAEQVLSLAPDYSTLAPLNLGVAAPHDPGHYADLEVRAFIGSGGYEDPVTGSLNASLAQWLIGSEQMKPAYIAAQGTRLQRAGRVSLRRIGDEIRVGGEATTVVAGEIAL